LCPIKSCRSKLILNSLHTKQKATKARFRCAIQLQGFWIIMALCLSFQGVASSKLMKRVHFELNADARSSRKEWDGFIRRSYVILLISHVKEDVNNYSLRVCSVQLLKSRDQLVSTGGNFPYLSRFENV